jgi:hypothetical protein
MTSSCHRCLGFPTVLVPICTPTTPGLKSGGCEMHTRS